MFARGGSESNFDGPVTPDGALRPEGPPMLPILGPPIPLADGPLMPPIPLAAGATMPLEGATIPLTPLTVGAARPASGNAWMLGPMPGAAMPGVPRAGAEIPDRLTAGNAYMLGPLMD